MNPSFYPAFPRDQKKAQLEDALKGIKHLAMFDRNVCNIRSSSRLETVLYFESLEIFTLISEPRPHHRKRLLEGKNFLRLEACEASRARADRLS